MKILRTLTLLSVSLSLLFSAPMNKKDVKLQEVKQLGKKSSQLLLKTLGKNMKSRMQNGGVMNALDFCSNEAYSLTEKVNRELPDGVSVKRVSVKYRSPANKPSASELAILETFENMKKQNIILPSHLIEQVDSHTYKYYKPLTISKKVCLKCHGVVKNIELKHEISNRYPLDSAMGYKMGDLRGVVIVTIKK